MGLYSAFNLSWIIVNDFQVEFFSLNHRKQWKLSVCKKDIIEVRMNTLNNKSKTYTKLYNKLQTSVHTFSLRWSHSLCLLFIWASITSSSSDSTSLLESEPNDAASTSSSGLLATTTFQVPLVWSVSPKAKIRDNSG